MRRRRIIIDALPVSTLRISGVGHATYGLIKTLSEHSDFRDYDIVLVTTIRGYRWLRLHNFRNVRYVRLPMITRVMNRLPATPLMPFMDLLLGRGVYIFPNFRSWPLLWSKSATFIHDVAFMIHPTSVAPRNREVLLRNVPRWIKRSTVVVTVSESSKAEIVERLAVSPERVLVAHNGVDSAEFRRRDEAEVRELQQRLQLPSKYVLFLGNIEPRKNLERLVRAYAALRPGLRERHPLVLVGGGGWLSEGIEAAIKQARNAGCVIVRPNQYVEDADLPALFSGAAMLAHPAIHEGFGMSPLQAMACDVPVLTSSISSMPEVVGEAALLVDPLNEAAITRGLERVLTDKELRAQLICAGRERIKHFSWEHSLHALFDWVKANSR